MSDSSLFFGNSTPRWIPTQPGPRAESTDRPHTYPLLIRDHSLATCWSLMMRSLPYAMVRLATLLGSALLWSLWLVIAVGGAAWIGIHVSTTLGVVWLMPWLAAGGWIWGTILRYTLHLVACGHVAVLTRLITEGTTGEPNESQFSYGRRIVKSSIGEITVLFGFQAFVRGVLNAFHETLDTISEMLPIRGLRAVTSVIDSIAKAATRYLDKVVLSYTLARNDGDPWQSAHDGIVYYCQNAKDILKTSVWILVMERAVSLLLFLSLFIVAVTAVATLPEAAREMGAGVAVVIAVLFAMAIRAAFIKPLFLISMLVRFHTLIEEQPINMQWSHYLDQLSPDLGRKRST